jgi:alpha-galactosidase
MIVAGDKEKAFIMYERTLGIANPGLSPLRLAGLDPGFVYRVSGAAQYSVGGDLLMQAGIQIPALWGDFQSCIWILEKQSG